jgi:hypothetical protein
MNQRIDPPVAGTAASARWRSRVAMLSVPLLVAAAGLVSTVGASSLPSRIAFLKSRIQPPTSDPKPLIFLVPNISITMTRMMMSSLMPMPMCSAPRRRCVGAA